MLRKAVFGLVRSSPAGNALEGISSQILQFLHTDLAAAGRLQAQEQQHCSSSELPFTAADEPCHDSGNSSNSNSSNSGWFQYSSSNVTSGSLARLAHTSSHTAMYSAVRGFASFTSPLAHSGCGHSHHDHSGSCSAEDGTAEIQAATDLQQLQQVVQQSSSSFNAVQTAAAFKQAAQLAGATPTAAAPLLQLLAPIWSTVLPEAAGKDLAWSLLSWVKLRFADEQLWSMTVAAVPQQAKLADGQDLANIAYALAAMFEVNGGVPGVPKPEVEEVLRAVTEEVVALVNGKSAGDGCGSGRQVSVGNIATVRWAHEVMEGISS